MSTERHPREGMSPEPEDRDPLSIVSIALAEFLYKYCDEMRSCDICPVREKCRQLWQLGVEDVNKINLTDYRRLCREFAQMKRGARRHPGQTARSSTGVDIRQGAKTPPVSTR